PIAMDPRDPARDTVGQLTYRGGLVLESPSEPRFGGWSDLKIRADGEKLVAISDRGFWLDARLVYDADGRLISLADSRIGHLIGPDGRRLAGASGDAEGLTTAPDGSLIVSLERRHRILVYPRAEPP